MRTVIVLGTGTDVGKTYVTVQLAKLLAANTPGMVHAVKPVETGLGAAQVTDATRLALASRPAYEPVHAFAFDPPVSPHLAARLTATEMGPEQIKTWLAARPAAMIPHAHDRSEPTWLLVESAGGVFSPINESRTNFDVAAALEPSCWILVALDRLGVLHNVRSTLLAMQSLGRVPDILILNAPTAADESTGTNRGEIERLGWAKVTAALSPQGTFSPADSSALLAAMETTFAQTGT